MFPNNQRANEEEKSKNNIIVERTRRRSQFRTPYLSHISGNPRHARSQLIQLLSSPSAIAQNTGLPRIRPINHNRWLPADYSRINLPLNEQTANNSHSGHSEQYNGNSNANYNFNTTRQIAEIPKYPVSSIELTNNDLSATYRAPSTPGSSSRFNCKCGQGFNEKYSFWQHGQFNQVSYSLYQKMNPTNYNSSIRIGKECPICFKIFTDINSYNEHYESELRVKALNCVLRMEQIYNIQIQDRPNLASEESQIYALIKYLEKG